MTEIVKIVISVPEPAIRVITTGPTLAQYLDLLARVTALEEGGVTPSGAVCTLVTDGEGNFWLKVVSGTDTYYGILADDLPSIGATGSGSPANTVVQDSADNVWMRCAVGGTIRYMILTDEAPAGIGAGAALSAMRFDQDGEGYDWLAVISGGNTFYAILGDTLP